VDTLLQIPRLYNVYKGMGIVTSFQNLLDNIFLPLFEVTIDPASHPQLHVFLKQVEKSLVIKNIHIDCSSALCHASTFHTSTIYLLLCASHMPVFFLLEELRIIILRRKQGERTLTNTPKLTPKQLRIHACLCYKKDDLDCGPLWFPLLNFSQLNFNHFSSWTSKHTE